MTFRLSDFVPLNDYNNNNLIGILDGAEGTIGTGTDIVNTNVQLSPLQNNGGLTLTHIPLSGSPAINAGNNNQIPVDSEDLDGDGDTTEQLPFDARGLARISGGIVDIGAVEVQNSVILPSITLAVSPASVLEDGIPNLIYTFTRTGPTTNTLAVNYSIAGTANTTDYTGATPGTGKTITFAAGSATATLTINPTTDTTIESDETVAFTLSTGTGYTIGTATAVTGTITNDDNNNTTIESVGNTSLVKDGANKLFSKVGNNSAIALKRSGSQLFEGYSGWSFLAAETVNGSNQALVKNSSLGVRIWNFDSNWEYVSVKGVATSQIPVQETVFGVDADGDGMIGNPYTTVEAVGNTSLVKDGDNKLFTKVGNNSAIALMRSGSQLYEGYSGWSFLAAESVNGSNQALVKNPGGVRIWNFDSNWDYVSVKGVATTQIPAQEIIFGVDGDGDGKIASIVESVGNTTLIKAGDNKLFTQVGTNEAIALNRNGTQLYEGYAGWSFLAAETVNGSNQALVKNSSLGIRIWGFDSNWNWTSVQAVAVESIGNTSLIKDKDNKLFTQVGTNDVIALNRNGTQLSEGYAGWSFLAAETLNSTNQALVKHSSLGVRIWNFDSNWDYVSVKGVATAQIPVQETVFGVDANGDSSIGNPNSLNLIGTSGNDTLIGGANSDVLTGLGGKDSLTGGLGSDRFGYQTLTDSLLANFDIITDFNANAGNDLFLVTTARTGFTNAGAVATLDNAGISEKLTVANFGINSAASFTFESRSFVAINDAIAGFSQTTDAIVEITGLTGTLGLGNFVTV
jgi:hypothetical protein